MEDNKNDKVIDFNELKENNDNKLEEESIDILVTPFEQDIWYDIYNDEDKSRYEYLLNILNIFKQTQEDGDKDEIQGFREFLISETYQAYHEQSIVKKIAVMSAIKLIFGEDAVKDINMDEDIFLTQMFKGSEYLFNILNNIEHREIRNIYFFGQPDEKDLVHVNSLFKGYLNTHIMSLYFKLIQSESTYVSPFTDKESEIINEYIYKLSQFMYIPLSTTDGYPITLEQQVVDILHNYYKVEY